MNELSSELLFLRGPGKDLKEKTRRWNQNFTLFFFRDFYISNIPTLLGHRYLLFLQKNIGILNLIIRYLNEGSVVYIIVEERKK